MKRVIWIFALAGLLAGCAWVSGPGHNASDSSGGAAWRGTSGISTGADVGDPNQIQ